MAEEYSSQAMIPRKSQKDQHLQHHKRQSHPCPRDRKRAGRRCHRRLSILPRDDGRILLRYFQKKHTTGIYRTLLPPGYFYSDVTLLVVGDSLYFHNLMDIFHLDTISLELTNITNGVHKNGLNKLQYADGYLYYYTYGKNAAIHRISAGNTDDRETVLLFNDGDFWYDNLLVVDNSLIFTGRQSSSLSEGEPEENFIRGTFKYSFQSGIVERIHEQSWGPACYVTHDYIVSIQNAEDKGADTILIMDYDGNDLSSSFPGLTH